MLIENDIFNWRILYATELISFSFAILISLKKHTLYRSILWTASNIYSAISMLVPSIFVDTTTYGSYHLSVYIFIALSIILPYFALGSTTRGAFRFSRPDLVAGAGIVAMMSVPAFPSGWQTIALGCVGGALVLLATAWVCHKNRLWRGFNGQFVMIFGLIACSLIFLWRGWVVFEARGNNQLQVDPAATTLWLQMLIFTSFCLQMGFLNLIVARDLRVRLFMGRRAARLSEGRLKLLADRERISKVANERLITLGLLTHEVRQPINNALAALEGLNFSLQPKTPKAAKSVMAINRARSVIDSINLAISNAIVAASFLEKNEEIAAQWVRAYDVAELARTDCPTDKAPRIEIIWDSRAVYIDIDPILVRLALRNLLDNALKYSPAQSAIQLHVVQREDVLGTSFKVTSKLARPDLLNEDIFKRRNRAAVAQGEGSGLGLYLVKKVAEAHGGTISYELQGNAMVTFDLFIPD